MRRSEEHRAIEVQRLEGRWAVARLDAAAALPEWAAAALAAAPRDGSFVTIARSAEELSIVAPEGSVPADARAERGFALLRVTGPLAFDEIGILARLTAPLAAAQISAFAISTFDTDYLLVRSDRVDDAARALAAAGVGMQ